MNAKLDSEEKIQHILNIARSILAKTGYAGTTISLVAAEAGISRGLLHYYFKNKEEMLAKVIHANIETSVDIVENIFHKGDSARAIAKEMTAALRFIFENDPDFFKLLFEGWAVSRHSALVDEKIKDLYSRFRDAVASGLKQAAARGVIAPLLALEGLAAVITGLIDGLGLQLITEPELSHKAVIWEVLEQGLVLLLGGTGA